MMALAVSDIFAAIESDRHTRRFDVRASYMEIYNEEIRDLLAPEESAPGSVAPIKLINGPTGLTQVHGLEERVVTGADAIIHLVAEGTARRSVGRTAMNAVSSRSHAVLRDSRRVRANRRRSATAPRVHPVRRGPRRVRARGPERHADRAREADPPGGVQHQPESVDVASVRPASRQGVATRGGRRRRGCRARGRPRRRRVRRRRRHLRRPRPVPRLETHAHPPARVGGSRSHRDRRGGDARRVARRRDVLHAQLCRRREERQDGGEGERAQGGRAGLQSGGGTPRVRGGGGDSTQRGGGGTRARVGGAVESRRATGRGGISAPPPPPPRENSRRRRRRTRWNAPRRWKRARRRRRRNAT